MPLVKENVNMSETSSKQSAILLMETDEKGGWEATGMRRHLSYHVVLHQWYFSLTYGTMDISQIK